MLVNIDIQRDLEMWLFHKCKKQMYVYVAIRSYFCYEAMDNTDRNSIPLSRRGDSDGWGEGCDKNMDILPYICSY